MPIIVSVYLGIAEAAFQLALKDCRQHPESTSQLGLAKNALATATLAHSAMVDRQKNYQFTPSLENSIAILEYKTIANNAIRQLVDIAANLVGGNGFFQGHPMERIIRDCRAMHFHPLPEQAQLGVSGRFMLGLSPF